MTHAHLRIAGLLVAGIALTACQPRGDEPTVGQKVDQAIESTRKEAQEAKSEIKTAVEEAKSAGASAAGKMEAGVSDAAITASVNAALARDVGLSVLKINVDTQSGRVTLSGTAPDEAARSRATELAAAVTGVVSVDNRLSLAPRG